jgi:hypothetical protein
MNTEDTNEPAATPPQKGTKKMNPIIGAVIGGVVGAGVGLAMYKFVGCRTGACPLTANPYVAMAIWGLMGAVFGAGR